MKVQIIRATIAQKRQVMPGDVLEVSKEEASALIGAGKAQAVKESVETTTAPVETAEKAAPAAISRAKASRRK